MSVKNVLSGLSVGYLNVQYRLSRVPSAEKLLIIVASPIDTTNDYELW